MEILQDLQKKQNGAKPQQPVIEIPMATDMPYLHALLTTTELEGKPRKPGSLTIFHYHGCIKARLWDPNGPYVGWYVFSHPERALEELEEALREGHVEWCEETHSN